MRQLFTFHFWTIASRRIWIERINAMRVELSRLNDNELHAASFAREDLVRVDVGHCGDRRARAGAGPCSMFSSRRARLDPRQHRGDADGRRQERSRRARRWHGSTPGTRTFT